MSPILSVKPLGFVWETLDPFLFCVHHDDAYPAGNAQLGPAAALTGRNIGQDFEVRDGWRMYHGRQVPGFPAHPHRGFETVTVVRRGFIDHSDSMGATARYGGGDTQWLTAGAGVVHCEMFPLVKRDAPNPLELFQIWLNLPKANKFAAPHFTMFWDSQIPRVLDVPGVEVVVIAGRLGEANPLAPPPDSWASRPDADVAIWTLRLAPGAHWTLPPARPGTSRMLYLFQGGPVKVAGQSLNPSVGIRLKGDAPVSLENGQQETEFLLLQGRPIGEPVMAHGPFVMNTPAEIQQAFSDYQRTRFGGWPWKSPEPVHPADAGKFARRPDGSLHRP